MKMDLIQCTIRLNQEGHVGLMEVVKSGPDAITPAEAVILMRKHSIDDSEEGVCIFNARKVGEVDRAKMQEAERLALKYGGKIVADTFPRGGMMPGDIEDLELPQSSLAPEPEKVDEPVTQSEPSEEDKKREELINKLTDAEVTIPGGNLSLDDLQALVDELEAGGE